MLYRTDSKTTNEASLDSSQSSVTFSDRLAREIVPRDRVLPRVITMSAKVKYYSGNIIIGCLTTF